MGFWNKERKAENLKKPFHFFEVITNTCFVSIVGIFVTLIFTFLTLSVLFFNPTYNQVILFSILGVVVFSISYKFFLRYNSHHLRNLNYESFLISKKKFIVWLLWTMNSYMLICWFTLILIGATEGFGLVFPTNDSAKALVSNPEKTKVIGLILMFVQIFFLILFKIIFYYWSRIFNFAYREFEKRRRALEMVRSKAGLK